MRTLLLNCLRRSITILCLGILPLYSSSQSPACNTSAPKTYILQAKLNEIYLPYTSNGILSSVRGGDTLKIPAGHYNDIVLDSFSGDPCKPVIIINTGGQVTSDYIRIDHKAQYFKLTGSGDSTIKFGFKIGKAGIGAGLAIGIANHYEITNLECANSDVGFLCKKNPFAGYSATIYPNYTISKVSIHDNYIHNTHGEGMYIGHTYPLADPYNGNLVPVQMDSVEIFNNLVDSTDWDGIQLSNAKNGAKIYNNVVTNYGLINMDAQQAGIILGANTSGSIYNNKVLGGTGNGIQVFGFGEVSLYNNLVINAGQDGTTYMQDAVFIDDRPMYNNPGLFIQAINNTIVNSGRDGIRMYNDHGSVASGNVFINNLIVQPNSLVTGGSFSQYVNIIPALSSVSNNVKLSTIALAGFADPGLNDYHLLAGSPAIDSGMDVSGYAIVTDFDNFNRPYGVNYDAGAYEFTNAPPPINRSPIANAGKAQVINLPVNSVTLTGSAYDLDGSIASYQWICSGGPSQYTITNSNTAQTTVIGLIAGTYVFQLKVTDNKGATGTSNIQITVNPSSPHINVPPTVNAGANQMITLPLNIVNLSGIATDLDGTIVSYQWNLSSGPAGCSIGNKNSAQTNVSGLVQGVYKFELKATDDRGGSTVAMIQVTVNPPPPVVGLTFRAYPNPFISMITISFNAPLNGQKTKLQIIDEMGRAIYTEEFYRSGERMIKQINLSQVMKGGYVISIDTGFDLLTTKMFKN